MEYTGHPSVSLVCLKVALCSREEEKAITLLGVPVCLSSWDAGTASLPLPEVVSCPASASHSVRAQLWLHLHCTEPLQAPAIQREYLTPPCSSSQKTKIRVTSTRQDGQCPE